MAAEDNHVVPLGVEGAGEDGADLAGAAGNHDCQARPARQGLRQGR